MFEWICQLFSSKKAVMSTLTVLDVLTSSGKYPERATHPEATQDVKNNIEDLLSKLNPFLSELGLTKPAISSGFRPSTINEGLPNSAKKSLHMIGCACDLVDIDGKIDALVTSRDDLKKKYGLWQEDPASTKSWCHLDNHDRGARAKNTFLP